MSLTLHMHPLSSFCQKVLIALYENATPFTWQMVDLADPASAAAFKKLWPMAKMPVLRDEARGRTIAESSIIIEYLDRNYPGPTRFIPAEPELALDARMRDRFYDLYVHHPMQKIVTDKLRPAGGNDPYGVEAARETLRTAYRMLDDDMAAKTWSMGEAFTLADCAAAPPLFYAGFVEPFSAYPALAAYYERLKQRPSFARALSEAQPYFASFPAA